MTTPAPHSAGQHETVEYFVQCQQPADGEQPETQETDDEPVCADEFPGDDLHAGQICTLRPGHVGQHRCTAEIAGTDFTRRLMWPNRERP